MVCQRCKLVVGSELERLGLHPLTINLGDVIIEEADLSVEKKNELEKALNKLGFELIDDRRSKLIEQIKLFVIHTVHYREDAGPKKFSAMLSEHLHHDYSYLSNLFSATEGITIEQFMIVQKIEKVKELITYDELSIAQIADQLGYSSAAHLSTQFKKLTGLTPGQFRQLGNKTRRGIDLGSTPDS